MKTYYKIFIALFVSGIMLNCEADDDLVNLEGIEAPSNLGATFQITQDNSGLVTIIPTGEGATSYDIDFGDGSPVAEGVGVGEEVEHVYAEGDYEVVVTGTNVAGKTAQGTQTLSVSFLPPENLEAVITKDAEDNYTIHVSATADNAAMYEVYFGEEEDEEPTPLMANEMVSHTYGNIGDYTVRVVALSGGAANTEYAEEISITDPLFLPLDFESETLDYTFFNFGGNDGAVVPVVENPAPDAVNSSAMVASYTKPAGSETWAGTNIALDEPIDFSTNRYIKMDVWSPITGADVILKVENKDDSNISAEFRTTTTTSEQWETLTFDLNDIDPEIEYGRIVLFFNMDVPGTGETYYFDNIETTRLELIKLPLTFESESLVYEWSGFGGAGGGVVANPDASGINSSAMVSELNKTSGAETWAGISLNLDEPVDFANGTIAKMKVYSPQAGVPILFKLEDSSSPLNAENNPSVFVEVTTNTTTSNEWEELSFDISSFADFNPEASYDRVIVFYDFGNGGDGSTLYFDDIRITSEDEPTSVVLPVTFEPLGLNYQLEAFEGAESAVEDNPFQSGINTSDRVMRTTKTEGALFYAGTTLQLEAPIDSSESKEIRIKSYSPKAGIPVRMKLENNDDPSIAIEVDATTITANEWEELVFDFSEKDTDQEYSKVILFYEFVPDLSGDGTTYYYDDIQLNN